jgi:RND family efflux transporter MFP subunit
MASPEGLAALKIDRSRRRSAWLSWLWLVAAVLIVAAFFTPRLLKQLSVAEVTVAPVVKISATTGKPSTAGSPDLTAAGYVVADRQSVVATKITGRLSKLNVAEAQYVKTDEVIAEVDHRELDAGLAQLKAEQAEAAAEVARLTKAAAQADTEVAAARTPLKTLDAEVQQYKILLADAQRRLERDRKLAEGDAIGFSQVDDRETEVRSMEAKIVWTQTRKVEAEQRIVAAEAQAGVAHAAIGVAEARVVSAGARAGVLETQLADCFIRSPFDGVVTEKAAEVGEIVAPISIGGSMARGSIATIADWASLQAEVDVPEAQIERVQAGQRAAITVDAIPEKTFPGKVRRILPRADRGKATLKVRVDFLARDEKKVLPEMGVRVKFLPDSAPPGVETGAVKDRLVVLPAALHGPSEARFVWVVNEHVAVKRPVVTGETTDDGVEIKSGVSAGDSVVVSGADGFSGETQAVRAAQ